MECESDFFFFFVFGIQKHFPSNPMVVVSACYAFSVPNILLRHSKGTFMTFYRSSFSSTRSTVAKLFSGLQSSWLISSAPLQEDGGRSQPTSSVSPLWAADLLNAHPVLPYLRGRKQCFHNNLFPCVLDSTSSHLPGNLLSHFQAHIQADFSIAPIKGKKKSFPFS